MTRSSVLVIGGFVVAYFAFASAASAQGPTDHQWSHGTTLFASAGAAMAPSADTRATLGGGFSWEVNHHLSVEGAGNWLVPRTDDQGFAADLTALFNLTRPTRVVPFVGGGVGLYIASFDTTAGPLPEFYQKRLPQDSVVTHRTFTDPTFVFTGGFDILAKSHLSIRPNVSARLVTDGANTYWVTVAQVNVAYHFELHETVR